MNSNGVLAAPERNHYFYGKLMDVAQFHKEQHYFNQKRWLLNRLGLGYGVVCGLEVIPDGETEGMLIIQPGVAIDGLGREIIVPEATWVNPRQPTDDQGEPLEEPIAEGHTVSICLAYAEAETDPVPVLVPDCDTPGNCACSTIREGFHVLVRVAEDDAPEPPACELGPFPLPPNGDLHALLCQRINEPCPEASTDPCVPLARVTQSLNGGSIVIDPCAGRRLVYGNTLLHEMILCLAERIEGMGRILRYVSGDGQTGPPNEELFEPLEVELLDAEGMGIAGQLVQFDVTLGSGKVAPATTRTKDEGQGRTHWTLGPEEGHQQVTASAVGTALTVIFRATANPA
jgi:hypothetical protein